MSDKIEEAVDEVIIASRRGTLFIRGGYGREEVWLGLAPDQRPEGDPDIVVELTPLMRQRLIEALTEMPSPQRDMCWFCESWLDYPVDARGKSVIEADVVCADCGGISRTAEDEDDNGSPVVSLAPVQCGHGIDHEDHCARCDGGKKIV